MLCSINLNLPYSYIYIYIYIKLESLTTCKDDYENVGFPTIVKIIIIKNERYRIRIVVAWRIEKNEKVHLGQRAK